MSALMERIGRKGLAIDELFASRNPGFILGRGVVCIIALDLFDWAVIEVVVNHLVYSRNAQKAKLAEMTL